MLKDRTLHEFACHPCATGGRYFSVLRVSLVSPVNPALADSDWPVSLGAGKLHAFIGPSRFECCSVIGSRQGAHIHPGSGEDRLKTRLLQFPTTVSNAFLD